VVAILGTKLVSNRIFNKKKFKKFPKKKTTLHKKKLKINKFKYLNYLSISLCGTTRRLFVLNLNAIHQKLYEE